MPHEICIDDGKVYENGKKGKPETPPAQIEETLKKLAKGVGKDAPWVLDIPEELKSIEPPIALKENRLSVIYIQ